MALMANTIISKLKYDGAPQWTNKQVLCIFKSKEKKQEKDSHVGDGKQNRPFFDVNETEEDYKTKQEYFVGLKRHVKIDEGVNLLIRLSQEYFDLIHERLYTMKSH